MNYKRSDVPAITLHCQPVHHRNIMARLLFTVFAVVATWTFGDALQASDRSGTLILVRRWEFLVCNTMCVQTFSVQAFWISTLLRLLLITSLFLGCCEKVTIDQRTFTNIGSTFMNKCFWIDLLTSKQSQIYVMSLAFYSGLNGTLAISASISPPTDTGWL